jgi:hypothetical protein
MPSSGRSAVLPVYWDGKPVFAQLRPIGPAPGAPRYLNAANRLTTNPRVGIYEPHEPVGRCVVVTEGVMDALSANSAGFRAAAIMGAALVGNGAKGRGGGLVADRLARLDSSLILAFDADAAGQRGATVLQGLLRERSARSVRMHVPPEANDLNAWMVASRDWQQAFRAAVRTAVTASPGPRSLAR